MKKFLTFCFWAIIVIGIMPALISTLGAGIFVIFVIIGFFWLIGSAINVPPFNFLFSGLTHGVPSFFRWLFFAGRRWEGARYMGAVEQANFLSSHHKGWLVDGKSKRLSEKISYQSMLTVGGMGKGKSSVFVMPNLYTLDNRSMVVTDTSGEIYDQTARYLERKGFDIQVLNLMDLRNSSSYNPLANAHSFTEIQQIAHLIIKSSPSSANAKDPFWNIAAEKIIRIIIQCLKNRNEPEHYHLGQVKYWLNQYVPRGDQPSRLDEFVLASCDNDQSLWNDYRGFIGGNEKAISSIIMTADVALSAISNPDIAEFVSRNEIDFGGLRTRKTVLYVMVRQQDLSQYAFLLNLFFTDLFRHLLAERNPDHLPVYLLLDEFGHLTIPDFAVFATTARKYKVAFWILLQSISQLESRYGQQEAETITDGLATEIYMSGVGIRTAEQICRRVGRKRRTDHKQRSSYGEINLLNADEIISLNDDEVLLLHSNKRPIRYRVTPFFRQWRMKRAMRV